METAEWLFWFAGPGGQYLVSAESLDDARRQMAAKNLSYDRCGPVHGPQDGMPPGIWAPLPD